MKHINQIGSQNSPKTTAQDLPASKEPDKKTASETLFENQLFTYKKAAQYLSISESYLRRLKNKGLISSVLVSARGIRFRVSSLNRWIDKREVK